MAWRAGNPFHEADWEAKRGCTVERRVVIGYFKGVYKAKSRNKLSVNWIEISV